jgi:squalene cyclase
LTAFLILGRIPKGQFLRKEFFLEKRELPEKWKIKKGRRKIG